jgi:hypothetical protein
VRLKVLSLISDPDDLHAAAMINSSWYDTYKTHELFLVRCSLRSGHFHTGPKVPISISYTEEKVPTYISKLIEEQGPPDIPDDTATICSEEESEFDDGESIAGITPAPSITPSLQLRVRTRNEQTQLTERALQRTRAPSPPRVPYTMPLPAAVDSASAGTTTPGASSTLLSSPGTPQAPSPAPSSGSDDDKGHVVCAEYADNPDMTHEEVLRILYGDQEPEPEPPRSLIPYMTALDSINSVEDLLARWSLKKDTMGPG